MKKNTHDNKSLGHQQKFFTVIIPCFNGQKYIAQAIQSVLDQTFSDFELIIINDGSTDNSLKVIEYFAKQDSRIQVITNKKNSGLSAARNMGLDRVKGGYVAFLDADDWWPEKKLTYYANAHKQGHDLVFSNYDIFLQKKNKIINHIKVPKSISYNNLKYANQIPLSSGSYNFEKISHNRFKDLELSEDWDFWVQAINHLKCPIGIQTRLLFYRRHDNNLTNNRLKMLKIAWRNFRINYQWGILQSCWGMFRYLVSKFGKYYI